MLIFVKPNVAIINLEKFTSICFNYQEKEVFWKNENISHWGSWILWKRKWVKWIGDWKRQVKEKKKPANVKLFSVIILKHY